MEINGQSAIANHLVALPPTRHHIYALDYFPMKGKTKIVSLLSLMNVYFIIIKIYSLMKIQHIKYLLAVLLFMVHQIIQH